MRTERFANRHTAIQGKKTLKSQGLLFLFSLDTMKTEASARRPSKINVRREAMKGNQRRKAGTESHTIWLFSYREHVLKELNINLNPDSKLHLYEQIYIYIRDEIRKGNLKKGEKLPSTRSLAQFLQISRSTAETAYDQLLSEGYIISKPHSGYLVAEISNLYDMSGTEERSRREKEGFPALTSAMQQAPGISPESVPHGSPETGTSGRSVFADEGGDSSHSSSSSAQDAMIDFSPRRIDMSQFPYSTWKRLSKENLVGANSEMFSLGEPNGDRSFREVIAHYLHTARGIDCDPDCLVIGAGNDYLLMLLRELLEQRESSLDSGTGKVVGMEYVTYLRAYRIFRSFGWDVRPVRMDEKGMNVASVREKGCSLVYVMPAHQYPSGVTMPIARRMELLAWANEKEGRCIVEDDYDSEFRYRGRPIPSLKSADSSGSVIYIGTFSKSIAPAIRVSYMLLPPALAERYHRGFSFFSSTVSRLDQQILGRFIGGGYFERYLNKMRTVYRGKRDILLEALKPMRTGFDVSGEDAGLHLLLREKTAPMSIADARAREQELAREAGKAGVVVYPMSDFAIAGADLERQSARATLLLGYAALSAEELRTGAGLLSEALMGRNARKKHLT